MEDSTFQSGVSSVLLQRRPVDSQLLSCTTPDNLIAGHGEYSEATIWSGQGLEKQEEPKAEGKGRIL